jgi:hypothetical protein
VLEPFGLQRAADLKDTLRRMIELHKGLAGQDAADSDGE